ncbi:MAG: phosphatase PAP2 family protein [Mediterranea sp.]|jgi:membrane-associated phospholipid phosphatase|nr:phosphatase PAP2 family protein [Mediterranea sp.]
MALDLFKKTETRKGLFAVEKVSLIYNLLTAVLILFLFRRMDHPAGMLLERVVIAVVTLLLMRLYRLRPCKMTAFVRMAVQMGLLAYWYPDTFEFNRVLPNLDHVFASSEQWLFGCQPALLFSHVLPQMWVSEPLNMGYFFYYPLIFGVAMFYFIFRYELFEKLSFVLVACFFVYYLIYICIPCAGPQFYFPVIGQANVDAGVFPSIGDYFDKNPQVLLAPEYDRGFFYNLVKGSQQVGERPTAAFPSSHVGISTILMVMAWRGSRRLFAALFPFYLLLCGATVYIQAHYLIDSIAGFLSAFALYILVTKMFKRWFAGPLFK